MRLWPLWALAIVPVSFEVAAPRFELLGQFSNMTYSQDHQSGQDVYLWRELNELYGYMEYSLGGALGDFTTARLENVRFDPTKKRLSFHVRNPLYDEQRNVIRNLFMFEGLIGSNAIEGTLACRTAITNEPCANDQRVVWRKIKERNTEMRRIGNRQDWETLVAEQLKAHGARW
jgi:ribosomal protein L21